MPVLEAIKAFFKQFSRSAVMNSSPYLEKKSTCQVNLLDK